MTVPFPGLQQPKRSDDHRVGIVADEMVGTFGRNPAAPATSARALRRIDAADKAAGIYRVSLDAAIEAAARAEYDRWHRNEDNPLPFADVPDAERARWGGWVSDIVTAAVMGGAQ